MQETPKATTAPAADVVPFEPTAMLTALEVALRLGFQTAKPIRAAIRRGELRASDIGGEFRILGVNANEYWLACETAKRVTPDKPQRDLSTARTRAVRPRAARRQPILGQGR